MSSSSNLYAERVFAEHPITLWSLDDAADYVSLISEPQRSFNSWSISGGTKEVSDNTDEERPSLVPFANSALNKVLVGSATGSATVLSPTIFTPSDINYSNSTVSISFYTYLLSSTASIKMSIESEVNGNVESLDRFFSIQQPSVWAFVSSTFEIPTTWSDIRISLSVTNDEPLTAITAYINGLSIGQASEVFQQDSLGQELTELDTIALPNQFGVPAATYGIDSKSGYYLADDNMLCAVNSSMPLVYGSSNSTRLIRNTSGPSLLIPGNGFMNKYSKHRELTFEIWTRIQAHVTGEAKRIIGPIASNDGIYVNDAFITLRIGSNAKSYPVSEWDRPMLIAIKISARNASLVINGEEVISFNLSESDLNYPDRYDSDGKEQDWIGIYCHAEVPIIEVDCIAIYPYLVPAVVEKRRWVFGQGVGLPPESSGSSIASIVSMDYAMSNYAKNYLYPDIGKFSQGINENLSITEKDISLPEYELPQIQFSNKQLSDWYTENAGAQDDDIPFISMKPTQFWNSTDGYILFNQVNIIKQKIRSFYGFFKYLDTQSKQTMFYLKNSQTGDNLHIFIDTGKLYYTFFKFSSNTTSVIKVRDIGESEEYTAIGLDIDTFVSTYGGNLKSFFDNRQNISVYVGGSPEMINTFSGRIYRVGFSTYRNFLKIESIFSPEDGTTIDYLELEQLLNVDAEGFYVENSSTYQTNYSNAQVLDGGNNYFGNSASSFESIYDGGDPYSILANVLLEHVASYTLVPKIFIGNFILDIAINGYWQDYTPLSYFSKKIIDGNNVETNSLDFIQFNVSYPEIKSFINNTYNTENAIVRTYVSFQDLKSSATISPKIKTIPTPAHGVIYPGSEWRTVKYEVVNDSIIYLPAGVDIKNTGIVVHVELLSRGISETPIKIKSIQLASQALSVKKSNPVGTKYGIDIYPLVNLSLYDDYKAQNPYSIYKGSTPHLYLTSTSGIRLRNVVGDSSSRKISIPVNKQGYIEYGVSGFQFSINFQQEYFSSNPVMIFEMESQSVNGKHIKVYAVADNPSGSRAKLYSINAKTGERFDGIQYFVNGRLVRLPVIDINTWTTVGFSFYEILDFSKRQGAARLSGPALFNNITIYPVSLKEASKRIAYRKWSAVFDGNIWEDWQPYTWQDVLFISAEGYRPISGSKIYKQYTGTDRIVVDDSKSVIAGRYQYRVFKDVSWQLITATPV